MKPEPKTAQADPDRQLLLDSLQEKPGAFEQLFRKYWQVVLRLALARLHCLPEAEDAAIETFADVWRGLKRFRGQARFSTWLYRVALNRIAKHIRTRQRRPPTLPLEEAADCADVNTDPAVRFAGQQRINELLQAIEQLPPDQRDALILRHLLELDLAEVAEVLELSPAAAGMRINRAMHSLRRQLTGRKGES